MKPIADDFPDENLLGKSLLVAFSFFVLVVAWSLSTPFHGAPDESTHLFLVEYLYRYGSIPTPGVDPVEPFVGELSGRTISNKQFWYFGIPYLNSLGAAFTAWLLADWLPPQTGYLGARAFNWLLAPIFALSLIAIARLSGVRHCNAILLSILFLLVPQATFLFSYVNADAFALTVTSLSLAALLWTIENPSGMRPLLFGLCCGLIISSKIYYYPSLIFFLSIVFFRFAMDRSFAVGRFIALSMVGAALIAAPVLGATYSHFGEVTGIRGQVLFTELHKRDRIVPCYLMCESGLFDINNIAWWLKSASKSFFFGLGWMKLFLPKNVYYFFYYPLILLLFALSTILTYRYIIDFQKNRYISSLLVPLITTLYWGMAISVILLNLIGSQNLLPQPQGRYLYVLFPFALFLTSTLIANWRNIELGRSHSIPRSRPE